MKPFLLTLLLSSTVVTSAFGQKTLVPKTTETPTSAPFSYSEVQTLSFKERTTFLIEPLRYRVVCLSGVQYYASYAHGGWVIGSPVYDPIFGAPPKLKPCHL
jgi:thiamine transporter ThiT